MIVRWVLAFECGHYLKPEITISSWFFDRSGSMLVYVLVKGSKKIPRIIIAAFKSRIDRRYSQRTIYTN